MEGSTVAAEKIVSFIKSLKKILVEKYVKKSSRGTGFTDPVPLDDFKNLCDLTKEFTKYKLKQACALRFVYSWRLLKLFEQHLPAKIEEFRHAMESNDSCRHNFAQLKRKIIDPAIKELCENNKWLIGFSFTKTGRKMDMLMFTFEKNHQGNLF